ncbi:hypothetical protein B0H14DRAFT_2795362 [Mycena olivaceomarginata]|nr:hypothetical protein B0H14DRAFT_2795362 [Mycena olivaceomarginata]
MGHTDLELSGITDEDREEEDRPETHHLDRRKTKLAPRVGRVSASTPLEDNSTTNPSQRRRGILKAVSHWRQSTATYEAPTRDRYIQDAVGAGTGVQFTLSSKSIDGEGPEAYQRRVNGQRTPQSRRAAQQKNAARQAKRKAMRAVLHANGGEFPEYASSESTISQASDGIPATAEGAVVAERRLSGDEGKGGGEAAHGPAPVRPPRLSRTGAVYFGETKGVSAGQKERMLEATHWSPTKADMTVKWVASMQ